MDNIINEILEEVLMAEIKHPYWPKDNIHGAAIICEESGRINKSCITANL